MVVRKLRGALQQRISVECICDLILRESRYYGYVGAVTVLPSVFDLCMNVIHPTDHGVVNGSCY